MLCQLGDALRYERDVLGDFGSTDVSDASVAIHDVRTIGFNCALVTLTLSEVIHTIKPEWEKELVETMPGEANTESGQPQVDQTPQSQEQAPQEPHTPTPDPDNPPPSPSISFRSADPTESSDYETK